jgi:hypothetical protein
VGKICQKSTRPPTDPFKKVQYPCPKFDISALLINIYYAYVLKQRSIGATSKMHLFPAKVGAKYAAGPTEPPIMPNFQQC